MNGYAVSVDEKYALESSSVKYKKVKKPGFIKRWLYKISEEAWNHKKYQESESDLNLARPNRGPDVERHGLDSNPMVMKIYRANGGTIVETTTYDRQKDRNQNQLHIIGHDTDLGHGLSKIITMESLRQ
jgi:hypothetical protein